jgi:hypothetical protein
LEIDFLKAGKYISSIKGYKGGHTSDKEYSYLCRLETIECVLDLEENKAYLKWKNWLHHCTTHFQLGWVL